MATLVLGVMAVVAVVASAPGPTVVAANSSAQTLMSVLVPACGVLLASDVRRAGGDRRDAGAAVLAAVVYAAAVALVGFGLGWLVVGVVSPAGVEGPGLVVSAAGGVAVQVTAQLVGTGLGFLVRRPLVAFVGTIVVPLGVWLVLGAAAPLSWLRGWITPFGASGPLLSGSPSGIDLVAWLIALVLWGGLLNAAGLGVLHRARR